MSEIEGHADEKSPHLAAASEDHDLLRRSAEGDREAFRQLAQRHQARILELAYRFLGEWHAAEDVCQDALVRTFEHAGRIEPEAKFTTWLYRVVANLCWDTRRRAARARRPLPPRLSAGGDAAEPVIREELQATVQRAITDLPDRQRMVLILHRFDDLGQREISEITGWSLSAVESCLVRAYANLRAKLSGQEDG